MIAMTLPMPPSVNALYRNVPGKGRAKTAEYTSWIKGAGYLVNLASAGKRIDGPYALTMRVGKPDNRKRDLGNYEKACSDLLVSCGAVRDDSDCQRLDLSWTTEHRDVFVMVVPCRAVPPVASPDTRMGREAGA